MSVWPKANSPPLREEVVPEEEEEVARWLSVFRSAEDVVGADSSELGRRFSFFGREAAYPASWVFYCVASANLAPKRNTICPGVTWTEAPTRSLPPESEWKKRINLERERKEE